MTGRGDRRSGGGFNPNRQSGKSADYYPDNTFDGQQGARGGGGGGRGRGGRGRKPRYSKDRGGSRDQSSGGREDRVVPSTLPEWEDKLVRDGQHAYLDLSLCFKGTPIPFTEEMANDLANPSLVAGQESLTMLLSSVRSLMEGRVIEPDGGLGCRIRAKVLRDEESRAESGG